MCQCNTKDQTSDAVLKYLDDKAGDGDWKAVKGIGMFVVPAPEEGILEYKVVRVGDLSYDDTRKRGEHCVSFKWLPYGYRIESQGRMVAVKRGDEKKVWLCIPKRCITQVCTDGCVCKNKVCS